MVLFEWMYGETLMLGFVSCFRLKWEVLVTVSLIYFSAILPSRGCFFFFFYTVTPVIYT